MVPTPTARDYKDSGPNTNYETARKKSRLAGTAGGTSEPNVGRVAHGIPGRVYRLKGLGNSIVPKIAEEIGKAIIKAEREK